MRGKRLRMEVWPDPGCGSSAQDIPGRGVSGSMDAPTGTGQRNGKQWAAKPAYGPWGVIPATNEKTSNFISGEGGVSVT